MENIGRTRIRDHSRGGKCVSCEHSKFGEMIIPCLLTSTQIHTSGAFLCAQSGQILFNIRCGQSRYTNSDASAAKCA